MRPELRFLAATQLVSNTGSAMAALAITFLAYTDSGSVLHTVFVATAYALPTALLGVTTGRVVERNDPKRVPEPPRARR